MLLAKKVEAYFTEAKTCNDEGRQSSAAEIRRLFEESYTELATDAQVKLTSSISESLFKLFRSSDNGERRSAMILLLNLIDLEINDYGLKLQCLKEVTGFLPSSDTILMEHNAALFIKYVQSSLITSDMFDLEMKRAKVYLNDDNADRKTYVLILFRECSRQIPTLFISYIFDSFHSFCSCLSDQRTPIRETGLSLLKNCLLVFVPRENRVPAIARCYETLYSAASTILTGESTRAYPDEVLLTALAALHEVVRVCSGATQLVEEDLTHAFTSTVELENNLDATAHAKPRLTSSRLLKRQSFDEPVTLSIPLQSAWCLQIVDRNYSHLVEALLKHCVHKNAHVAQLSMSILALLSGHNTHYFAKNYLTVFMNTLFILLNNTRERGYLFTSLAVLSSELREEMVPHINRILKFFSEIIPEASCSLKKQPQVVEPALIGCLSVLVGYCMRDAQFLHHIVLNILEHSRLTPAVVTLLVRCADQIHDSQSLVMVLVTIISERTLKKYVQDTTEGKNAELVVLALRTIRALEILDYHVKEDLYNCSQAYLNSSDKVVRLEAAKTCCQLISLMPKKDADAVLLRLEVDKISRRIFSTLKRLAIVGVSDPESDIRLCVLTSLSEYNEEQLASLDLLRIISLGLRDESVPIRSVIIDLLGRLAERNPVFVVPLLDQHLVECLSEFKSRTPHSGDSSARLLCCLVASTPRVAQACMHPVLDTVLPCLADNNIPDDTLISLLAALGDLSFFCGPNMSQHMPALINALQSILVFGSVGKKEAAMECLVLTVRHTGYFIESDERYVGLVEALLSLLSSKQGKIIKRAAVGAFGVLGARDPHCFRVKVDRTSLDTQTEFTVRSWEESLSSYNVFELLQHYSSNGRLDEFYAGVVIDLLLRILSDPSLAAYHSLAVQVIENVCVSLSSQCHRFLSLIFPAYIRVVRYCDLDMQRILLDQVSKLIPLAKSRARPYVDDLFTLIDENWCESAPLSLQMKLVKVVQHLLCFLPEEASRRLPRVVSRIVGVFLNPVPSHDPAEFDQFAMIFLTTVQHMGPFLRDHLHVLVPALIKGFDISNRRVELRKLAIATLQSLFLSNDLQDFVVPIVQALLRAFSQKAELSGPLTSLLLTLFEHAPVNMKVFVPSIVRIVGHHSTQLDAIVSFIRSCPEHQLEVEALNRMGRHIAALHPQKMDDFEPSTQTTHTVNCGNLVRACQTSQRVSKEDWDDWLSQLSLELVKEAPSSVLRACSLVSQAYGAISHQLFAFSFFSCWRELNHATREALVNSFSQALHSSDASAVAPIILALAEFMEHADCEPLPLQPLVLAACANNACAYAKALRYTEMALRKNDDFDALQSLISYNTLLNNRDAAQGVLVYAASRNLVDLALQHRWFEKLHDWKHALKAYDKQLETQPGDSDLKFGKMHCLEALCEWSELDKLVADHWSSATGDHRARLAIMGSVCAIGLGRWKSLEAYICALPKQSLEGSLFKAVNEVRSGHLTRAKVLLENAQSLLENEFLGNVFESYEQSYRSLLTCQMLSELDEVIDYQLFPSHRPTIESLWEQRLRSCKQVISDWHRILDIRAVVLEPRDNLVSWLKLAGLCRREGRHSLSTNIFARLLTQPQLEALKGATLPDVHPLLTLHYVKHMWVCGKQLEAFAFLDQLVTRILPTRLVAEPHDPRLSRILSKAHLQLGLWTMSGVLGQEDVSLARENFVAATEHGRDCYKAWNAWAKINYEIVMHFKHDSALPTCISFHPEATPAEASRHVACTYAVPAIHAIFRSVQLSEKNAFQDTLRLLTLWFDFGEFSEVYETIEAGLGKVKLETWLQVVPQLIARIDTPKTTIRLMIQQLLVRVGSKHPQALVYPLMVSVKSLNDVRTLAVSQVLKSLSENFPGLVEQAEIIRTELIRVSILWCEAICVAIDEASRLFFNEKDIPGTLKLLDDLHLLVENGPETPCETSFLQSHGEALDGALRFRQSYAASGDLRDLLQAWAVYYRLYRRLSRQIAKIKSIDLQYASPRLLQCRDLILPVPGTYHPHTPVVCIHKVDPSLQVIGSKQKPRKLTIRGNNGQRYDFLLKGHEDLRQDERVMQLFGLLNNLLLNCQETYKRRLEIHRYAVVPLSTESGLIGWVPHTDTLHALIKEFRSAKGLPASPENMILSKCCPQYEILDLIHKVEAFEYVLDSTSDDHLAASLWQKSANSEIWLEKRTNFTRSLALMSVVGYVLGLGDRHPSNIMQDRNTGRIVHIDFGDCFEVAMRREKFPERVPFRLTRMLTRCMEVTGIDGTFKVTAIHVMELLREHKDSLLAVLEAFIHDPLLNWRLLESKNVETSPPSSHHIILGQKEPNPDFISSSSVQHSHISKSVNALTPPQILKKVALGVIKRVRDKLSGTDFEKDKVVDVRTQVELLIDQATSVENLAQSYIGWSPFW